MEETKRVDFGREEYLIHADVFETGQLVDPAAELREFSDGPEAMAVELAYTRYELAKAEKALAAETNRREEAREEMQLIRKHAHSGCPEFEGLGGIIAWHRSEITYQAQKREKAEAREAVLWATLGEIAHEEPERHYRPDGYGDDEWYACGVCEKLIDLANKTLTNPSPRAEAIQKVLEAAEGLCHGDDWDNGTQAKLHGYKRKLKEAVHVYKDAQK